MQSFLDIKSGKAMPWTALQLASYTLLDCPVEFQEEGHLYEGGRLPSTTGILKAEGFIDARFYTEESRTRGTYVHLATHYDDSGELDEGTVDPDIMPYLEAWRKFKAESGFIVERSEVPMKSSLYHYAGTIDRIGTFPKGNTKRAAVELHKDGNI
jgi:hypothetical protein